MLSFEVIFEYNGCKVVHYCISETVVIRGYFPPDPATGIGNSKGYSPADVEESKFLSEELHTLNPSAKASLESYFNEKHLLEGLEESDIPAVLTHLTDV